ncbi:uncharacterized protein LOC129909573 [Episyrphus balteatus]|uniref:uncharacterized protein LOC129909573 n=1 Tax=Episyrphus balteatus TaxID=286459 RepID=UPI0024865041|nr:uncharacterized protein LOC129909573 [Episyrphus balteatus]
MKPMFVLFGALVCLILVSNASAQCLCASKGMDFCSCAAAPPAVRPVPKVVPRLPLAKFPPIGDSCWCGKQVVEPAIPPKPSCKVCDTFEWLSTLKTLLTKKLLNTAIEVKKKCIGHMQTKLDKIEQLAALAVAPPPLPPAELPLAPLPEPALPPSLLFAAPKPAIPLALLPAAPAPPPTPALPAYSYCSSSQKNTYNTTTNGNYILNVAHELVRPYKKKTKIPPAPPCKCSCSCAPATAPALPPRAPTCFDSFLPPSAPPAAALAVARPPGVPADPLSISMALTARKSFAVPEAKLSYGPVAAPLNYMNVRRIYMSNIPEEKLFGLNGQIIEVKKKFPAPTKAELLAEAIEEAEEEAAAAVAAPAPYLSYSDIGYGPALIKKPLFMRLSAQATPALGLAVGPKPLLTGCGYVPGKISQAPEYLEQPLAYEAPCL